MNQDPYWKNFPLWKVRILKVVTNKFFDLVIAAIIGINIIFMATEYHKMPHHMQSILNGANFFFTAVFVIEALLKIIALGFLRYLRDRWNQLDVCIVILSVIGLIFENGNLIPFKATIIRVMRVLRIARVLKLLKMAKGIRELLDTVIQALPQVGNLGLLFFLLFFIFAALGVELFGKLGKLILLFLLASIQ
ncbi:hypothetical protein Ciccas_001020 [Cichlidogyrus casuarinus]|uniref:Ion transport domain-containing protein n=1 Tax=Cichlidogyrus casuarinus TaxID=1844966 RepID=A0ABD2QL89_9PLAT